MHQRANIHLTREDRQAITRWSGLRAAAASIIVLGLLIADYGFQRLSARSSNNTQSSYTQSASR